MSHQAARVEKWAWCMPMSAGRPVIFYILVWQTGSQWKGVDEVPHLARVRMHERPSAFSRIDFFFLFLAFAPLHRYLPKWLVIHISSWLIDICSCINIYFLGLSLFRWLEGWLTGQQQHTRTRTGKPTRTDARGTHQTATQKTRVKISDQSETKPMLWALRVRRNYANVIHSHSAFGSSWLQRNVVSFSRRNEHS